MRVVIYGDFNCPFSALASVRVARLAHAGIVECDWRAVAHDLEISRLGEAIGPSDRRAYAAEIEQVRGLLLADETIELDVPTVRANTVTATEAYAATAHRAETRSASTSSVPIGGRTGTSGTQPSSTPWPLVALARCGGGLREEWLAARPAARADNVLPDGYVRGLGALARLGDLIGNAHGEHRQTEKQT